MKSFYSDSEAKEYIQDPVQLRVYTSRLLGRSPDLVLHGGGNTSVKASYTDLFGEKHEILYVKGSGWDLATIEAPGFAPVKLDVLKKMAQLEELSDIDMVKMQRAAMINPNAPNPSVEAILHAIIPFQYVDHTHADAVITLSNTPNGEKIIQEVYGDSVIVIPYVMPGFVLAKKIRDLTKGLDWKKYKGMILLNHGVFTFADSAKESYENMIDLVTQAEEYLNSRNAYDAIVKLSVQETLTDSDLETIAHMRKIVSGLKGKPVLSRLFQSDEAVGFSSREDVSDIARRGPLTPDHVIRTKSKPVLIDKNYQDDLEQFQKEYKAYFKRQEKNERGNTVSPLTCLDPAPRFGIWRNKGILSFGSSVKEMNIIWDIYSHTLKSIQCAESIGGWQALSEGDLFDMEYWTLEQAKIQKKSTSPLYQGKVALVTGAASGIGAAVVREFVAEGACVVAIDKDPKIVDLFDVSSVVGIEADVTDRESIKRALAHGICSFGGLDIVVSNAGIFPETKKIQDMDADLWDKSISINLSSHQRLLQLCIPYLTHGIDPSVVIIASKNVPAPGPGASAYSVAKAGLTQLARIAALELGEQGIRVNVVHPNQVFDTGIWTDEVLENRAASYKTTVAEYKIKNLLKKEISSQDVARLVVTVTGPAFSKTTGAQIPIDGGNERVI